MRVQLWMQNRVKGVGSKQEKDLSFESSEVSADELDEHELPVSIDEIVMHAASDEEPGKKRVKFNSNQKHEGPYLLIQLEGEKNPRKIAAETRGRCWRLPKAVGISYSLMDEDELNYLIGQFFERSAVSLDTVFGYDYTVPKKSGNKREEVNPTYRKPLEAKLNQALNAYKAQLYVRAELKKIGLCEVDVTLYQDGRKLSPAKVLRRLRSPPLERNRLTVVDGKIHGNFVAICEGINGDTGDYHVLKLEFARKLQEIYVNAAKAYKVKVPKII